ncbi:MAG: hypothetical protein NC191_03400 [Muribaculaceae bacterium]|nr:hypothetical protein [Muribaculaceae bacterium]
MLNGIQNIVANPTFFNVTQGTAAQMGIKTSLNAVARPGFILLDKNIDSHTKKFSASKEFLYQAISLAMYLGVIIPVFKHGAYALAKNKLFKDEAVFKAFPKPDEFKKFFKLGSEQEKIARLQEISKATGDTFVYKKELGTNEQFPVPKGTKVITESGEHLANGVIESSSLIGTILGLAVIAPLTATKMIHPILKSVGLVKDEPKQNA